MTKAVQKEPVTFTKSLVFDGHRLHRGQAVRFVDGVFAQLVAQDDIPSGDTVVDLGGDILSHGYVDLQVNGGDGLMFNDDPSVETLRRMAGAHQRLGTIAFLPTLITDTPRKNKAAISAVQDAIAEGVTGIRGLHLEGPHLSIAKKGAHDAAFTRPMEEDDLQCLVEAAKKLPLLKITLAPEVVTLDQVARLVRAGILVSLGHTDADFETCRAYFEAGAQCATHLFNAMSQLGSRAPGLVGAVLSNSKMSAGLIADGIHVHPATMQIIWAAKNAGEGVFLVSDAMAVAGTNQTEFFLEGRRITRSQNRLTLGDGTLAGADLDLTNAVRVLVQDVGVPLDQALAAATRVPGALINCDACLTPGATRLSSMIRIAADLSGIETY